MHTQLASTALVSGAACVGWGFVEARLYRTVEHQLNVLPEGAPALRILQVSDTHLRPGQKRMVDFLRGLRHETYDLVVATGDMLGSPATVELCAELLNDLTAVHGRYFVFGASDYYSPQFHNYLDYFTNRKPTPTRRNPTQRFRDLLTEAGWVDINNRNLVVDIAGMKTQITGLDDPHLRRDDLRLLVRDPSCAFALCVVHDPGRYRQIDAARYDLSISGHTHGGQIRFPLIGAVVSNSDLPPRMGRGATRLTDTTIFVSPGLGTSKYAPVRFLCRPEASVLNLRPRSSGSGERLRREASTPA